MINYDGKIFQPIQQSENSETGTETRFHYKQQGNILTSKYSGGNIKVGHLLGLVSENGQIEMRYHQINLDDKLMTGTCISTMEVQKNGKMRLYEKWKWTSGDQSEGTSILEEI